MGRSRIAASCGVLALVSGLTYTVALPAWHGHLDHQWEQAGELALTRMALPASFHAFTVSKSGYATLSCGPARQCFVADGDPRSNVSAVRAALTPVLRGSLTESCRKEGLPAVPDRCLLRVPVAGSRLVVALFAKPAPGGRPLSHFSGSYVEILVDSR